MMGIVDIIFLAIGLAMDCFAVATTKGISTGKGYLGKGVIMALLFGLFQGSMPLLGYFAGSIFSEQITKIDHWIALILLCFIGGKMIWDSVKEDKAIHVTNADTNTPKQIDFSLPTMIGLAIATSIDALATGIIFVPTPEIIWLAVGIIALVSFIFAFVGYLLGSLLGERCKFDVNILGGLILIGMGIKIFMEHMCGM